MVYDQLPVLHAGEAGDVAMGSERFEMAEHVLGHKGFVLTIPVVHVGTAYALEARGIDGLVGIAHGTPIARGVHLGKFIEQSIEIVRAEEPFEEPAHVVAAPHIETLVIAQGVDTPARQWHQGSSIEDDMVDGNVGSLL